jgi:DNA-binding Lrp family transcriptional regulator
MDMNVLPRMTAENLTEADRRLVAAIQHGLPLVSHPYAELGRQCGLSEAEVINRLAALLADGTIKRLGVVVRHRELGYRANAMVVWDIDDARVSELGHCIGRFDFVTLCYRRPRRLPAWPYNLFCMIHGQDRDAVLERVRQIEQHCGLADVPHEVLFSRRRFKQRGAIYAPTQSGMPQ